MPPPDDGVGPRGVAVTVTSVSRAKISTHAGYDTTEVAFDFAVPVVAWTVRVGSTDAVSGHQVDHYDGHPSLGLGGPLGHQPFGSPSALVTSGTTSITPEQVAVGANDVAIYAHDLSGGFR